VQGNVGRILLQIDELDPPSLSRSGILQIDDYRPAVQELERLGRSGGLPGQDNTNQRHAEQQPDAQHRAMIALLYVERHDPPVRSVT
jgi:hypothetical protein